MAIVLEFGLRKMNKGKENSDKNIDTPREDVLSACKLFELIDDNSKREVPKDIERGIIKVARNVFEISPDAAINTLTEFTEKNKVSTKVIKQIACMYIDNSQYDIGIEILERLAQDENCSSDILEILAFIYTYNDQTDRNDYNKALKYLEQDLKNHPNSSLIRCKLGDVHFPYDINESLKAATEAKTIATKNPKTHKNSLIMANDLLILIYEELDEPEKILEIAEENEVYETLDSEVLVTIAKTYNQLKNYPKALEYYDMARQNSKDIFSEEELENNQLSEFIAFEDYDLIDLADLYVRFDRFEEAKTCIDEALKFVNKKLDAPTYAQLIRKKNEINRRMGNRN